VNESQMIKLTKNIRTNIIAANFPAIICFAMQDKKKNNFRIQKKDKV
jgi:hypothetical protein